MPELQKERKVEKEIQNIALTLKVLLSGDVNRNSASVMESQNEAYDIIRLFFLKYVIDNHFLAETKDELELYFRAKRVFSESGLLYLSTIKDVLSLVDEKCNLNGILSSAFSSYRDLFRCIYKEENKSHYHLLGYFSWIDMSDRKNINIYTDAINKYYFSNSITHNNIITAKPKLLEIIEKILAIRPGDSFCSIWADGPTVIEIGACNSDMAEISVLDSESACIAAMYGIIRGVKNLHFTVSSFTGDDIVTAKAKRVFASLLPLTLANVDGRRVGNVPRRQLYHDALQKVMDKITDEDGIAVVQCFDPLLRDYLNFSAREYLTGIHRYVKAVISLPALLNGTSRFVSLLILSKEDSKDILFIDASETEQDVRFVSNVVDTYCSRNEIPGFSKIVSYDNFRLIDDFQLAPSKYVDAVYDRVDYKTVDEINLDIENMLTQIKDDYPELGSILN